MEKIPFLPAKNIAPVKPLFSLKDSDKPTPTYVCDGLKELLKDLLDRNKDTFKEIATTTEVTSNFIQGKQIWRKNHWNDTWTVAKAPLADSDRITSINIMQFYCTSQMKMMTASNPDLEPAEEYRQYRYKSDIKIAKAVWAKYESSFYKPWINNQEALHAITSGTYVESVFYDHLKHSSTIYKEIFGDKEIEISPGYSKCFEEDCGYSSGYQEFTQGNIPRCPECGSTQILPPEAPVTQTFRSVVGVQPITYGNLSLRLLPIQALRFDVKKRVEESSWLVHRMHMHRNAFKYLVGSANIPTETVDSDFGLKSLLSIAQASNTLSGAANQNDSIHKDDIIVDYVSLLPEDYAHIIAQQDEETVSGHIIKKGTRFSDECPNGMTMIAVNNGEHILGIYPGEHHRESIASGVYHMRLESGLGRGSEDTVEVQKRFLRLDAQNVKFLEATATPAHTVVKGSVDKQYIKKIGHPTAVIPINPEVAQAFGTTDVIRRLEPGSTPAQFFQYTYDILNQYRQLTSHSTDFTNAFPGVDNRTATGAKMAKANADSIYSPFLQLKAEVRRTIAQKTLKLYKKHFTGIKQYFSFGETETGQSVGDFIDGTDVNDNIEFVVVRDSEQPKTPLDRQMDFVNMMAVAGQGGGLDVLKSSDPRLYEAMMKSFDIDLDDNTYSTMVDVCENRLEQAFELSEQYRMFQDTAAANGMELPELPIDSILMGLDSAIQLEEPLHDGKMKWFMDYLDTPLGQALTNSKRQVVALFVRTHALMFLQQQQALATGFAMVAAASIPAEEGPDPQAEADAQGQIMAAENEKNEMDHQRQLDMENVKHRNQMELKGVEHAHDKLKAEQEWAKMEAQKTAQKAGASS